MQQQEIHPFKWFVPKQSSVLMIGTFPPTKKNWSYDFFYPNKMNLFWLVMSRVAGTELKFFAGDEAVEERKQLLTTLGVAITDMGHTINRAKNSSLDENLAIVQYMDILTILVEYPSITKLIFTSSSGPSSAAGWFIKYLKSRQIIHKFPKGPKPVKSEFNFNGRLISLAIVYSPSRRAANRISFDALVEMYKAELLNT